MWDKMLKNIIFMLIYTLQMHNRYIRYVLKSNYKYYLSDFVKCYKLYWSGYLIILLIISKLEYKYLSIYNLLYMLGILTEVFIYILLETNDSIKLCGFFLFIFINIFV